MAGDVACLAVQPGGENGVIRQACGFGGQVHEDGLGGVLGEGVVAIQSTKSDVVDEAAVFLDQAFERLVVAGSGECLELLKVVGHCFSL